MKSLLLVLVKVTVKHFILKCYLPHQVRMLVHYFTKKRNVLLLLEDGFLQVDFKNMSKGRMQYPKLVISSPEWRAPDVPWRLSIFKTDLKCSFQSNLSKFFPSKLLNILSISKANFVKTYCAIKQLSPVQA